MLGVLVVPLRRFESDRDFEIWQVWIMLVWVSRPCWTFSRSCHRLAFHAPRNFAIDLPVIPSLKDLNQGSNRSPLQEYSASGEPKDCRVISNFRSCWPRQGVTSQLVHAVRRSSRVMQQSAAGSGTSWGQSGQGQENGGDGWSRFGCDIH